jgi:hypothetical protein
MGVAKTVAYGILLTDRFGGVFDGAEDIVDTIEETAEKDGLDPIWVALCPSAEGNQYVLGLNTTISKTTDFAALHKEWGNVIAKAPKEVQEWAKQYDPDVHFMAGKD